MDSFKRYKFFYKERDKQVIAVTSYAGKPVRAVAKCNPNDEFNMEKGKRLAAARCDLKVAEKRMRRASDKFTEAIACKIKAQHHADKIKNFYIDALDKVEAAEAHLNFVLSEI